MRARFTPFLAAFSACLALTLAGCSTDKGATWPAFGQYRLPYADGTQVKVNNDFTTHDPIGRYDLKGKNGTAPYAIVASAGGWVRYIVDSNTGHQSGDNNYVWIEHPFPFCQPNGVTWPGKPADYDDTCVPCLADFCNEWTKYSHMTPDSTTMDAGLSVGDWVAAGTFLGYEDDIGHATGPHLHTEWAKLDPDHPFDDVANGWTHDWSDDGWVGSPNLLPSICGIGILYDGDTHTAAPCPEMSKSQPQTTLRLQWNAAGGNPIVADAAAALMGPDRSNHLTIATLALQAPVAFTHGVNVVTVTSLRLVRPITIPLNQNGVGHLPADQLIWTGRATVAAPNGTKSRVLLNGPVRGALDVSLVGTVLQLSLQGELGTISGSGQRLR